MSFPAAFFHVFLFLWASLTLLTVVTDLFFLLRFYCVLTSVYLGTIKFGLARWCCHKHFVRAICECVCICLLGKQVEAGSLDSRSRMFSFRNTTKLFYKRF